MSPVVFQVHVNLGIALEGEGMLMCACEHYQDAAILNPDHYRALKLLGSALGQHYMQWPMMTRLFRSFRKQLT
jgi:hypothetical protein